MASAADGRWVLALEDGTLWLHKDGPVDEMRLHLRLTDRAELRAAYPRLYAAFAADHRETPKIVREPRW